MASLNIPFVLFQPSLSSFVPTIETSKLIPFQKYILQENLAPSLFEGSSFQNNLNFIQQSMDNQYQEQKPLSPLEDAPKHLVVMCDTASGVISLFHYEYMITHQKVQAKDSNINIKSANKFLINMNPRIVCIPSISTESGPVIDYTLIRSPAENILSSSSYILTTLHQDNRLRLWNTNDGRCLIASPVGMLVTKAFKLKKLKNYPGLMMVLGDQGDISVINVYTMTLITQLCYDFKGCVNCLFRANQLILCDTTGKIFVWRDQSQPSPIKNIQSKNGSAYMGAFLEYCHNEDQQNFKLELEEIIGGEDDFEPGRKILSFYFISSDCIIIVSSNKIELLINRGRKTLYHFEDKETWLVFAKFFITDEREMLICVNRQGQMSIFDAMKLKHESLKQTPLLQLNIFEDAKVFDDSKPDHLTLLDDTPEERQQSQIAEMRARVMEMMETKSKPFKFSPGEFMLYTMMEVGPKKGHSQMVNWNLAALIENINYSQNFEDAQVPVIISSIQLFPKTLPNCLINFNPIILRNYYNQHQFQFFFSDEKIMDHVVYTSIDHPSLIIGTNYGRIFIISMFQETEEKILPVVVVDAHHQSPIKFLFIAYNSSRKSRYQSSTALNQELGGHLISASEDGTVAVTNLNSGEMHRQLRSFSINERQRRRVDAFMTDKDKNRRDRRRNSFHQLFTTHQFFYLVKAKPQRVFDYLSQDGNIVKVLEVKSIRSLQERIIPEDFNIDDDRISHPASPERNREDYQFIEPSKVKLHVLRRADSNNSGYGPQIDEPVHSSQAPQYACIGKDGTTYMLTVTNVSVEVDTYLSSDSEAIGIYEDEDQQLLYILSNTLNIFVFNKLSQSLIRKGDFQMALSILRVRESMKHLVAHHECFQVQAFNKITSYDYSSFSQFFKRKNILMGLGNHTALEYLSISLNFPLNYAPISIYSSKHSKAINDLLNYKHEFKKLKKDDEALKETLRQINHAFFLNNRLYKSDFNQDLYERQNGVSVINSDATFCNSRQQILIANTKKMISVMNNKASKIAQKYGKGLKAGMFFQEEESKTTTNFKISPMMKGEGQMNMGYQNFASLKWPTRLLSLVHPFNLDENIDENLEQFFGLCLPFLDFRLGVQGVEESFSFICCKEDEDFYLNRNNGAKMINLLKLSKMKMEQEEGNRASQNRQMVSTSEEFYKQLAQDYQSDSLGRFFNSEYWKISSYMSTVIPTFFLSVFVQIIDFAQEDIQVIIQDWLYLLQRINQQNTMSKSNCISMSALSKIILKKDHNISSTARDVIMKPILYTLDIKDLKVVMEEWQNLIMDTYKKLKKESSIKQSYGGNSGSLSPNKSPQGQGERALTNQMGSALRNQLVQYQNQGDMRLINRYFGELEIRGLINLSYFSLYYTQHMDQRIQYRVSKLTTILTREIVDKYFHNKKYIHLLIILLQLLSTWMKTQHGNQKNKQILEEVIKLLLFIFNSYKSALNKEAFITRVTGENFHLIRPTHSELFLKLTAAKALLEIGEKHPQDFLQLIQEQATTLAEGNDYQQNVLEILKYYINGYGENLEHHLIQLTQILLKCLDPNDLALRKNSHKIISIILSSMVKLFPMVAFHHESQRLAVGTHDGPIAIYDVRTSAKWKILEGHVGNVTCLAFDSKGNVLCSYSSVDLTVKLWKVGNAGFFSTIMGGTGKSSKEKQLNPLKNVTNPHQQILKNRQNIMVNKNDQGTSQNIFNETKDNNSNVNSSNNPAKEGSKVNKCHIKFLPPKEKDVEVIREDGKGTVVKFAK